jgi:threonine synthase
MNLWRGVIDRYRKFLPITEKTPVVSLNEGNTPLIRVHNLGKRLGVTENVQSPISCEANTGAVLKAMGIWTSKLERRNSEQARITRYVG